MRTLKSKKSHWKTKVVSTTVQYLSSRTENCQHVERCTTTKCMFRLCECSVCGQDSHSCMQISILQKSEQTRAVAEHRSKKFKHKTHKVPLLTLSKKKSSMYSIRLLLLCTETIRIITKSRDGTKNNFFLGHGVTSLITKQGLGRI